MQRYESHRQEFSGHMDTQNDLLEHRGKLVCQDSIPGDTQLYGERKGMLYVERIYFNAFEYLQTAGFPIYFRTEDDRLDRGNGL